MKKKTFKESFLGVRYQCVKDFCDALQHFSEISGFDYKKIVIDYMLVTKKELKNRFRSDDSACIAVCGSASDFERKKDELGKILDGWSSKNCDSVTLCSMIAPYFSMSFKDKDEKLLYFRTKGEYAPVRNMVSKNKMCGM